MTPEARPRPVPVGDEPFRSRRQLETLLRRIADGVTVQSRSGRLVYANDAAAQLCGFPSAEELLATPVTEVLGRFELLDEERRPFPLERLPGRLVLERGEAPEVTVCYRIRATGEERWSIVRATAILDEDGAPEYAVNVFHEITAVKREDERARFMAEATNVLNSSFDLDRTLAELGRLAVPTFADCLLLDLVDDEGSLHEVTLIHADPERAAILRELRRRYGVARGESHPATRALTERRAVLLPDVTDEHLRASATEPDQLELYGALGLRSYVVVPLLVRGRPLGTLSLGTDVSGRRLGEGDLPFFRELGNRLAAAVDNAVLQRASRENEERLTFLAEAGELLASSLDYERTLASVARLVVPRLADWCAVDMVSEEGSIERLAVAHVDPGKVRLAEDLRRRLPPDPEATYGVPAVIRSGRPELVPEIPQELIDSITEGQPDLRRILHQLGLRSSMIVPLQGRERVLGAILFVSTTDSGRRFSADDLRMAEELARRAAAAVENTHLYREAERRADAARALEFIGEGVVLVDAQDVVRVWNPAAEAITGLAAAEVVGRPAAETLEDWETVAGLTTGADGAATTLPVEWGGRERWLSLTRGGFADGAVLTFRDVTEEHRLERLKDEFVATVSHQLRTPVTAVYGAARTLARSDVEIEPADRARLFELIRQEADRLARIVNDILAAGQLEAGRLAVAIERCDALTLVERVAESARVTLPAAIDLRLDVEDGLPSVAADPGKVEQVLSNIVENGVKYSPDGGTVRIVARSAGSAVRFAVEDEGLGIPAHERERVFSKFYRLDPHLTRGVGGTGLGLYVCRGLVERMGGRIWVAEPQGGGTVVAFELPAAPDGGTAG